MRKILLITNLLLIAAILGVSAVGLFLHRQALADKSANLSGGSFSARVEQTSIQQSAAEYFLIGGRWINQTGNLEETGCINTLKIGIPIDFDSSVLARCKNRTTSDDPFFSGWVDKFYFDGHTETNNLNWIPIRGWLQPEPDDTVANGVLNAEDSMFIAFEEIGTGVLDIGIERHCSTVISLWTHGGSGGYKLSLDNGRITLERTAIKGLNDKMPAFDVPLNFCDISPDETHHITVVRYFPYKDNIVSSFQILIDGRELVSLEDSRLRSGDLWFRGGRFNEIRFRGAITRGNLQPLTI